jgi:hypothetical protein
MPVVVHDDLGHTLREIFEFEFDDDAVRLGVEAVPDHLGEGVDGLGTRLPSHEVFLNLDPDVLDRHSQAPYANAAPEGRNETETSNGVYFDGGERKELAGPQRGKREHGNRNQARPGFIRLHIVQARLNTGGTRAADDFPAIRARMEELRRQRAGVPADDDLRRADGPRPYSGGGQPATADQRGLSPAIRRAFLKVRTG